MRVEIRPLAKNAWHGKEGAEDFTQDKVIEALVNPETGKYDVGMTPEEVVKYGDLLGVDLSPKISMDGKPHPFYGNKSGWVRLPNRTFFLDTTNPLEFVKYKICTRSKFVANSLKEWEQGLFPEATHVIFDEEAEINRKASKIQKKNIATKISLSMTLEEKSHIIQLLRNKCVREKSQDFVDVIIDEIVETNPDDFIRFSKMEKQELYIRAMVQEAIYKNILTKEGMAIYYMGDLLGSDYDEVVKYFLDPNNQKQKIIILERLTV
jgi:hypothetical protein